MTERPDYDETPRMTRAPVIERTIETAERDAKAARMRMLGFSYRQIARQIDGIGGPASAQRAVQRALAEVVREPGEALLKLETERYDHLLVEAMKIVNDAADSLVQLQAMDRVLKISAERRRLLGMDAPVKSELRVLDATDAAIEQLAAEVAALEGGQDVERADA